MVPSLPSCAQGAGSYVLNIWNFSESCQAVKLASLTEVTVPLQEFENGLLGV